LGGRNVGITDKGIYEVTVEIYVPYFMKIGIGVQAVLRFCLRNLRGCNFGITGGKDL
jgi:hypothetical protein